jgi:glycosyltransferase involved in cell wall biosynthesis
VSATEPLVSIVIPSFNQGEFIRDAIESVLGQDYPAIELIVMDAGSTDGTLDVLRELGDRFTWVSEPDRGQGDAINKGWRHSHGEILSWLCADDGLCAGAVTRVVDEFARHADAGLVYGQGELVDIDRRLLHVGPRVEWNAWELIHDHNYICQPAAFARRADIEAVGYVDESLHWAMDWDLFIRLALRSPMVFIPEPLAWVRMHDETKSSKAARARLRECVRVLRRYSDARHPPSYYVFAIDAYKRVLRDRLDRMPRALRPATTWAHRMVDIGERAAMQRFHASAGEPIGWYEDRWAAPFVEWTLPPGQTLRLRGTLPPEYPHLHGMELVVTTNRVEVARERPAPGAFTFDLPMPEDDQRRNVRVRITADKHFVPRKHGIGEDSRRISYLLDELETRPD